MKQNLHGTRGEISLPLLSNRAPFDEVEIFDSRKPSSFPRLVGQSREEEAITSPLVGHLSIAPHPLRGEQLIREAVLLTFCEPLSQQCSRLRELTLKQWLRLLRWLDFSGLALYFFDRLIEFGREDLLPDQIFARLQQSLRDNTERTRGLAAESIAIQQEFQNSRLSYSVLKGLSLWPSSVPKPELRSQFDLDFLVAIDSASAARKVLERRGYRLYAISGNSWEFKRNERPGISLKDLYKDLPSWRVELHIEPAASSRRSSLQNLEWRKLYGFNMPTLSPIDLFIGQGLHTYKHICSEFMRVAHLEEFRRHILFRREDKAFWNRLQHSACENRRTSLGLGVATLLITRVMGEFAPEELTGWTVRCLPASAHLWCQMYGHRAVLGSFPGSKLYLLLQGELENEGITVERSVRQSLLPKRLPPPIIRAFPNEPLSVRLGRYRMQLNFIFQRLRFHLVEGIRYTWESQKWRRNLNHLAR
ncbi:MAG TPA: nucleotidyltransferase family protein [Terracidiphilus sp.]|nr:nucleotidyltransferase family protein [Terracidiphilus sp.]